MTDAALVVAGPMRRCGERVAVDHLSFMAAAHFFRQIRHDRRVI